MKREKRREEGGEECGEVWDREGGTGVAVEASENTITEGISCFIRFSLSLSSLSVPVSFFLSLSPSSLSFHLPFYINSSFVAITGAVMLLSGT